MTTSPASPHASRPATPRAGVASVTTLPPPHQRERAAAPVAAVQGTLALDLAGVAHPAPRCTRHATVAALPSSGLRMERVAYRFALWLVEVLNGDRVPQQLLGVTGAGVYEDLTRRARALGRTTGADQRTRRLRMRVCSVHVARPHARAVELSVRVRQGPRSRALAARLDLVQGRWMCTALQVG